MSSTAHFRRNPERGLYPPPSSHPFHALTHLLSSVCRVEAVWDLLWTWLLASTPWVLATGVPWDEQDCRRSILLMLFALKRASMEERMLTDLFTPNRWVRMGEKEGVWDGGFGVNHVQCAIFPTFHWPASACVCLSAQSLSLFWLFEVPWTVAHPRLLCLLACVTARANKQQRASVLQTWLCGH